MSPKRYHRAENLPKSGESGGGQSSDGSSSSRSEGGSPSLLLLPLLQGLSRKEFLQIAGRVRFNFRSCKRGETIVREDQPCRSLLIVTSGELCATRRSDGGDYVLQEWMPAPYVLQPEALFGWRTHYTRSFLAATDLNLLEIDKDAVRDELFLYPSFCISFLNQICYTAQRREKALWRIHDDDLRGRFSHFLLQRCLHPSGRKALKIRKEDLAVHLDSSIRHVTPFLRTLQDEGLLVSTRGLLTIPSLERLIAR